ncbi:flippase [Bifidobacterium animalis subsp. animalis MCC 1489]|uniref:Flippase Wzx n=1 Tax=Bifidobacterium animalis subsp. animalis IM386 TaxID=1402194 RepID=A0AAV2W5G5_9BIFI|nr:flippase [Bifidobacterium animalis]AFI63551.1 flippase Wzx [Bifidobacterium animalis subsp. animalis ATCC 25527]AYN24177.1 flippase Wzx [Bifidobacterium animalis subsp. animalis]KFI41730.1 flippase Wzx [Bifidobacterium animalis subsp. animalis]KOA63645.1 flippase [Bifidobacterium animalis subsp. animalis MCC 1489]CDI68134.1 Flippase Wzx [Bifidobacterium animalis subsp. animalis IM386]
MSKSLVKNSFFNVVYQLLNVLFPLITAPYVARVLLPENVGKVAVAQNWAQYFIVFAALGLPTYAVRETAQHRKNKQELDKAFSELLMINTISTTISVIAYIIMLFTFGTFRENIALYLAVGAGILFNYITIDWLYQGIEDYGYIAMRSFIVKLLSLIALLVLVRNRNDFVIYALISTCAVGANNILNVLHLPKIGVHLTFRNLTFKQHVKPIMIFFANSISVRLYTLLNVTFLGIFSTDDAVAFYSNSDKVVRIIITVIAGIGNVLLPRLSIYAKRGEKKRCSNIVSSVFNILFFIFVPTGIGLILMSKEIVLILFGSAYAPSILTLQIMSLLIYTLGFNNLFVSINLAFAKDKEYLICSISGALSCLVLNYVLIPVLQQNGTAIASVLSEGIVTGVAIFFSAQTIKLHFDKKIIAKTILASILMAVVVYCFKLLISNLILCLIASVGFGSLTYIIISWLLKNPVLFQIINLTLKCRK